MRHCIIAGLVFAAIGWALISNNIVPLAALVLAVMIFESVHEAVR